VNNRQPGDGKNNKIFQRGQANEDILSGATSKTTS
jgi:hypothetical protein